MRQKIILVKGATRFVSERLFEQSSVEAISVSTGERAIAISRVLQVDLLVLPDRMHRMSLQRFLEGLRGAGSESRSARVLVLAGPKCPKVVRSTRDSDMVIVEADRDREELERDIEELLRKKPRAYTRVMVNIGVAVGEENEVKKMCQAVNVSETGILIRSATLLAPGTEVAFEVYLPEETAPVRGHARVVRGTDSLAEGFRGMGLRFSRFDGAGEETLRRFLRHSILKHEISLIRPG